MYLQNAAALSEKLPILVAPLRFGASCAVNSHKNSYKPLLLRNYSSLTTFLLLTFKTHFRWVAQATKYVRQACNQHFKINRAF